MRRFEIKLELEKKLIKLAKKDKRTYETVLKKIQDIVDSDDIEHYKNLRHDMKGSQRVHIGHFVLIFSAVKESISFEDFEHHDKVYRSR